MSCKKRLVPSPQPDWISLSFVIQIYTSPITQVVLPPPPPPPILHNLCFLFLLGIAVQPKEIEDNASANDWGVKKMCYGRCAMLKWEKLERLSHWKGYGWSTGIYFFSLKSGELLNENKWHCTIIRCKLFFLFICQEPITWPANNC